MSRQIKKKEINKYKIKINKLQNKIYELEYLFQIKSNACVELLQDNEQLSREKNKIIKENRNLRAENYNLKNRGIFQRILNRG